MSKKNKKIKQFKHKIALLDYWKRPKNLEELTQVVNVYEHTFEDFTRNFEYMTKMYRKHLGRGGCMLASLGQMIEFRVVPKQEPFALPLFKFMINYIMLMPRILLKVDMTNWEPWVPADFTVSAWRKEMDRIIYDCRNKCTIYQLDEYLAEIKYQMNQVVVQLGDILGHSISNNEFIELMKRDEESRKSIECTFDIPKDATPDVLEKLATDRTKKLLNTMTDHQDLSCSVYAKNGLFNPGQAREFFVHIGYKPDLSGNTTPFTANTNILMGTEDPRAHVIDARGGRKAELLKLKVSDAGDFERAVSTLMSSIRFVDLDYNCDSPHFRRKKITGMEDLMNIDGRVATLDKKHYFIVNPRDPKQKLIGKTINMKTPITCTHPLRSKGYICSACYGKLLASMNQDVHVGRMSALNDADEMEQKLLSAKHALTTKTSEIKFNDVFDQYFVYNNCVIGFNQHVIDRINNSSDFDNYYIEINPASVTKHLDGENRHLDKSVQEIVIYNSKTGEHEVITEEHGLTLFIHPDINDDFYYTPSVTNPDEPVRIKFEDIVVNGMEDTIFEYQYKNFEIADPLTKLNHILNKGKGGIDNYDTFDECLDELMPLFVAGGIVIPDIHIEMLIACLIYTKDMQPVDWTEDDPEYKFYSIDTSIKYSGSVVTSLLYKEANKQIAGNFGTYTKTGTSIYDVFLSDRKEHKIPVNNDSNE